MAPTPYSEVTVPNRQPAFDDPLPRRHLDPLQGGRVDQILDVVAGHPLLRLRRIVLRLPLLSARPGLLARIPLRRWDVAVPSGSTGSGRCRPCHPAALAKKNRVPAPSSRTVARCRSGPTGRHRPAGHA